VRYGRGARHRRCGEDTEISGDVRDGPGTVYPTNRLPPWRHHPGEAGVSSVKKERDISYGEM
jgi:hypothetical protein